MQILIILFFLCYCSAFNTKPSIELREYGLMTFEKECNPDPCLGPQTCCITRLYAAEDPPHGCCPEERACCCPDFLHCCPNGFECLCINGTCISCVDEHVESKTVQSGCYSTKHTWV